MMEVIVKVNGDDVRRLSIENTTKRANGQNTYRWSMVKCNTEGPMMRELTSGEVVHTMEDGALALVAKVCLAADVPA